MIHTNITIVGKLYVLPAGQLTCNDCILYISTGGGITVEGSIGTIHFYTFIFNI